jgi:hypothetical protein
MSIRMRKRRHGPHLGCNGNGVDEMDDSGPTEHIRSGYLDRDAPS